MTDVSCFSVNFTIQVNHEQLRMMAPGKTVNIRESRENALPDSFGSRRSRCGREGTRILPPGGEKRPAGKACVRNPKRPGKAMRTQCRGRTPQLWPVKEQRPEEQTQRYRGMETGKRTAVRAFAPRRTARGEEKKARLHTTHDGAGPGINKRPACIHGPLNRFCILE